MSNAKERLRQKAQNQKNDLLRTKGEAIAAKDARIAELEGVLAKALAFTEANTFGGTDALALIEECHTAIAGQQQPGPATHSEDGRDICAAGDLRGEFLGCSFSQYRMERGIKLSLDDGVLSIFLTDAQPARQVGGDCGHAACKSLGEPHPFCDFVKQMDGRQVVRDREADRQRFSDSAFNQWLDEVLNDAGHTVWDQIPDVCCAWHGWENRQYYAQPARQVGVACGHAACKSLGEPHPFCDFVKQMDARQVGVDELIKNDSDALVIISRGVLAAAIYAIREKKDAPVIIEKLRNASIGDEVQYAALAPAAVVMPEPKEYPDYETGGYISFDPQYNEDCCEVGGWNDALEEVARLNRRAIPVGLLERVCAIAECEVQPEGDELRALLGKES